MSLFLLLMLGISIHAPREGGDTAKNADCTADKQFQSTPPARGATQQSATHGQQQQISIHAPREGGDQKLKGPWANNQ